METILEVAGLTHYFGGLCAVSNFNLTLLRGGILGIIGPNGSGKTTLFNLLTGIYKPSSGKILFKCREITGLSPYEISSAGIARTFQNIRLFKTQSVLDNILTAFYSTSGYGFSDAVLRTGRFRKGEEMARDKAYALIGKFGLTGYANIPAGNLPYGLARRLEAARAMAFAPELLLLDEPAAGMNPSEIIELMELIRWLKAEFSLTIILIEHHMGLVMGLCERLKVLDFGVTIAEGEPTSVREDQKVLDAYLGSGE